MPTPSAAAKDTITDTISSSGATIARSSTIRISEHDEQRERDDQLVVARGGLAQVVLLRRRAADQRRRPPTASRRASGSCPALAVEYGAFGERER